MQRQADPPKRTAKSIEVSVLLKDGREEEFAVSTWALNDGTLTLVLAQSDATEMFQITYPAGSFDRLDVHAVFEEES